MASHPPILGLDKQVQPYLKNPHKTGNRQALSKLVRAAGWKETADAVDLAIEHQTYNLTPYSIRLFSAELRADLIIGSLVRFENESVMELVRTNILTVKDAVRIAKFAVVNSNGILISLFTSSHFDNKFAWAIDIVENAEFGDVCHAAFRLALASLRKGKDGREFFRLTNWAKSIIRCRPIGNPSDAAVLMHYAKMVDKEFMIDIIDSDNVGDPCGAIFQAKYAFVQENKKDYHLAWLRKRLENCVSGDPCYWLSKTPELMQDTQFVKLIASKNIGAIPSKIADIAKSKGTNSATSH